MLQFSEKGDERQPQNERQLNREWKKKLGKVTMLRKSY